MRVHRVGGDLEHAVEVPMHRERSEALGHRRRAHYVNEKEKAILRVRPVVATENDVAHIARALHAGANEYIMKPFDKEIVTATLHEVGLI